MSGVWTDFKLTTVEDQQKFIVPINKYSENLFYNQRMIIDNMGVSTEPRAWIISKVNRIQANGNVLITLAQSVYDQHKDYIERDENNNIIGMWADYYDGDLTPETDTETDTKHVVITYKGAQNRQFKVGGSARTFIAEVRDKDDSVVPFQKGTWNVTMNGQSTDLFVIETVSEDSVKIKVAKDNTLIGKTCIVNFTTYGGLTAEVEMNIVGL